MKPQSDQVKANIQQALKDWKELTSHIQPKRDRWYIAESKALEAKDKIIRKELPR